MDKLQGQPGGVTEPRMAVVTVNYRGADDTIECLAALFSGETVPYVIVADNDSRDGSVARIAAWAEGRVETPPVGPVTPDHPARPGARPAGFEIIGPHDLARGIRQPLTIVETGGNLGFAGGNNQGLRLALATPGVDIFWLLNNDTTVEPDSVAALRRAFADHPDWGMVGTRVTMYHAPGRYQLLNGMRFNRWTGAAAGICGGMAVDRPFDADAVRLQTDFVSGASLAVSRDFLDRVGLMDDNFFLYYEEIDWATRAAGRFAIGFAPDAVAFHKEGASAGSASKLSSRARSPLSEYHHIRSKMLFCRKHLPHLLPLYTAQNLVILLRRLWRRQPPQAAAIWRAMLGRPLN